MDKPRLGLLDSVDVANFVTNAAGLILYLLYVNAGGGAGIIMWKNMLRGNPLKVKNRFANFADHRVRQSRVAFHDCVNRERNSKCHGALKRDQ